MSQNLKDEARQGNGHAVEAASGRYGVNDMGRAGQILPDILDIRPQHRPGIVVVRNPAPSGEDRHAPYRGLLPYVELAVVRAWYNTAARIRYLIHDHR